MLTRLDGGDSPIGSGGKSTRRVMLRIAEWHMAQVAVLMDKPGNKWSVVDFKDLVKGKIELSSKEGKRGPSPEEHW
jgi:hypothetical protein